MTPRLLSKLMFVIAVTMVSRRKLSYSQNFIWNFGGSITYLGCQWLLTVLVVRLSSGFDEAGALALAMSIANLFVPIAQYRTRTYQVSDVMHEYSTGEYLAFRIITCLGAYALSMIYAVNTCSLNSISVIAIYLAYKAVELIIDVFHGLDQQNSRMDYIGISMFLRGILSVFSFSICLTLGATLDAALLSMVVVTVPVGLLYDVRFSKQFDSLIPTFSISTCVSLGKRCFLPMASLVVCSAAMTIPRQILSSELGAAALGIYASVASPVALVQTGASYIYTPLLGDFARSFDRGDMKAFIKLVIKISAAVLAVAIFFSICFIMFGPAFLQVMFGSKIVEYSFLLLPMLLCAVLTAYQWFLNDLLMTIRSLRGCFLSNLLAACLAIPLSYILVKTFGMNGVSFTGICSYGIASLIALVFILIILNKKQ